MCESDPDDVLCDPLGLPVVIVVLDAWLFDSCLCTIGSFASNGCELSSRKSSSRSSWDSEARKPCVGRMSGDVMSSGLSDLSLFFCSSSSATLTRSVGNGRYAIRSTACPSRYFSSTLISTFFKRKWSSSSVMLSRWKLVSLSASIGSIMSIVGRSSSRSRFMSLLTYWSIKSL